ncbi:MULTISPECIES: FHA domain-containing protein [Pseudoalteromonas]|uniref:FHA domain-containing protein n=1 Tax=Pseudoalteromonas obscura TaxID=3048491 RepID=A0ABT7ESD1_9GAMM|nr:MULTISPECIES: FHA domain-containing protein [Pseudoalteromonas]MBQ4835381.1 FHA domain-containing protein [Pseudoalteromonas luteoviolacea]MDK2597975.1 FHA domain-containing protein [Pseudoalteromonas sp. P94(2023)]
MAYLIDELKLEKIYLKSYHTFGRFKFNVDTFLDKPGISRHHAIIEYTNDNWLIRDVSTNGIWINDRKIDKNLPYQLSENDKIDFAAPGQNSFVVGSLNANCQYFVSQNNRNHVIEIENQMLLPNEEEATHIVYYDNLLNYWFLEDLNTSDRQALIDGGITNLFGEQWLFYCAGISTMTKHLEQQPAVKSLALSFAVSLDEEKTELSLHIEGEEFSLGSRSHHYLLLLLARLRIEDKQSGVDPEYQGWIYREDLAKKLGIQMNHMNIMVHRARKQLSEASPEKAPEAGYIIETNNGQLRLNCQDVTILKGAQLETRISL